MSTFTIAAAQSSPIRGDISANIRRHETLVALAEAHGADVIVFPELSLTGYEPTLAAELAVEPSEEGLRPLSNLAQETGVVVMVGCPIRCGGERPYIGMLAFQPDAEVAVYRKRFVHTSEEPYFSAGEDTLVISAAGKKIGAAICADVNNPTHAADAARLGAQIYAAGVAKTPGDLDQAEANMASRAQQHHMLTLMANYTSATGGGFRWLAAARSGMSRGILCVRLRRKVNLWSWHRAVATAGLD